jgi:hypothetical protein
VHAPLRVEIRIGIPTANALSGGEPLSGMVFKIIMIITIGEYTPVEVSVK